MVRYRGQSKQTEKTGRAAAAKTKIKKKRNEERMRGSEEVRKGGSAPDGRQLDVQFFEDAPKSAAELASARKQSTGFNGTTIANAFVFSHPDGKANLSRADLATLKQLLR